MALLTLRMVVDTAGHMTIYLGAHDPPLLSMTLRRNGQTREWTIESWQHGWSCRYVGPGSVSFRGCMTLPEALEQKRRWEADIDAARADGWT